MATDYPGALDNYTKPVAGPRSAEPDELQVAQDLTDAVNAIEGELGVSPSGSDATVVARLDRIDTELDGISGGSVPAGGSSGQVLAKASGTDYDTEWVDQSGGGGGATNLSYTASATDGTVASSTGTDATLPLADGTNAGLMAPAQYTQLAGLGTAAVADLIDEDDMASDSATKVPTQQSVKAYVDANAGGGGSLTAQQQGAISFALFKSLGGI